MSRTIIITEQQERFLKHLYESGISTLKQENCTDLPEEFPSDENGVGGTVAGRPRGVPMTDKVAKEISVPDFNRFGKYVNGY